MLRHGTTNTYFAKEVKISVSSAYTLMLEEAKTGLVEQTNDPTGRSTV